MTIVVVKSRCLTKSISGIGRYTADMIISMKKVDKGLTFILDHEPSQSFSYLRDVDGVFVETNKKALKKLAPNSTLWGPSHVLPLLNHKYKRQIITINDLTWKKFPRTMSLRGYIKAALTFGISIRKADKIVCISKSTASDLEQYYPVTKNKIQVIYPAVINKIAKENYVHERPFALFVGTFEPRKNIKRLIEAFAYECKDLHGKIDLVIAGQTGWGGVDIASLIFDLRLEPYVKIFYHPNDEILGTLYKSCAFLVMPSLHEGFGLPVIEAKFHGKNAILSNNSSLSEIADDNDCLIEPTSVESIAQGFKYMYQATRVKLQYDINEEIKTIHQSCNANAKKMIAVLVK